MLVTWNTPDGTEVALVERLAFVQGGMTVYFRDGRAVPVRLSADAVAEIRRLYYADAITRLVIDPPPS
ncbi:hypothetical protein [Roseomonas fluvialis]|uniref:Uncharacterized protein n=1 Tax=Roseomonas fluvialis TaxID=1750527 RepID=A0ABM7Y2E8_9PROT|nr:hypothetical protein [Roseomonas fluvialis]BDG71975.1 hypothetical protein Rmf_19040 [Roseomonas fluvialis]